MLAVKGGWVGQTFALASASDSGGKKSRIRRSKEERKTMVETFIKKYQIVNDGNFPSLNLTHKEVGGSFYTVREIVREIIQENKVLGPSKLPFEEDINNDIMKQFPIGSISIQPPDLSPVGESDILPSVQPPDRHGERVLTPSENYEVKLENGEELDHHFEAVEGTESSTIKVVFHQSAQDELLSNSIQQQYHLEHAKVEHVTTGSYSSTIVEDGRSDEVSPVYTYHEGVNQESYQKTVLEQVVTTVRNSETSDIEEGFHEHVKKNDETTGNEEPIEKVPPADYILMAKEEENNELDTSQFGKCTKTGIAVETFPLRPVTQTIVGLEGRPDKESDECSTHEGKINGHERKVISEDISSLKNMEEGVEQSCSTSERTDRKMNEEASLTEGYLSSESANCLTKNETLVMECSNSTVAEAEVVSSAKILDVPKDINNGNVGATDSKLHHEQTRATVATAKGSNLNNPNDTSSRNRSNPTLDRTKLETWEGTSEKPSGSELKSVLALFKAFIAVVVRFFTE